MLLLRLAHHPVERTEVLVVRAEDDIANAGKKPASLNPQLRTRNWFSPLIPRHKKAQDAQTCINAKTPSGKDAERFSRSALGRGPA